MLDIPTVGFSFSLNEHNVELDALCDWIEGCVLFDGDDLSESDVVDVLRENEVYTSQDLAWGIVADAWRQLRRRCGWLGARSPLIFRGTQLGRLRDWREAPAQAFCLALAYAKYYPIWAKTFGANYTQQGALFESLTAESLQRHFPDWRVHLTGWTNANANKLTAVVAEVATLLGEPIGSVMTWTSDSANEAGLDLICFRSFDDHRPPAPVMLVQCASGKHYEGKLHTPNLRIWGRIVEFTSHPSKAFSTPFALNDREFKRVANLVDGLLLDRYRLLSPVRTQLHWVSEKLKADMINWAANRIAQLPRLDS